jgi:hypothetical protein
MKSNRKFSSRSICVLIATLLTLTFLGACKNSIDKDDEDRVKTPPATPPPAQISFENGEVILTMDEPAQKRMGIEVGALAGTSNRPQTDVPATVLSVQDLAAFRNGYVAALSQIEKNRVDIEVARKQYARVKSLFDNDQNTSAKTMESTEGNLRALETQERAAEQGLTLQGSMAEQQWGSVVAKWAMDGSPELDRILGMREVLIQVTFPFNQNYAAVFSTPLPPKRILRRESIWFRTSRWAMRRVEWWCPPPLWSGPRARRGPIYKQPRVNFHAARCQPKLRWMRVTSSRRVSPRQIKWSHEARNRCSLKKPCWKATARVAAMRIETRRPRC